MTEIANTLARLRGSRVLVVGDVMLDEYVHGEVQRISPEAPVPVLELRHAECRLGGAANAAANIQALGGVTSVIGVVGADPAAADLRGALARVGVTERTCIDPTRPTTKKTRVVAQQQQIVRIDHETRAPITGPLAAAVIDAIRTGVAEASAIVVSDYAKGVITAEIADAVISAARTRGIPVIVDPKQHDFSIYRGATVITPNLVELERAAAAPTRGDAEIAVAVARLAQALGQTAVLVTRGADGMTLFRDGARCHHVPAAAREVYDVTGAGDTVVAMVALALAAGVALEDAIELASLAAGVAVSKRGTATIAPEELAAAHAGRPR